MLDAGQVLSEINATGESGGYPSLWELWLTRRRRGEHSVAFPRIKARRSDCPLRRSGFGSASVTTGLYTESASNKHGLTFTPVARLDGKMNARLPE